MSRFLRVKCECGNEQNIFGNATRSVHCEVCKAKLTSPSGSRAKIADKAKVIKVL